MLTTVAAHQVLDSIDLMDAMYYTAKVPEREVLRLVWERINHPVNAAVADQLNENLIQALADCQKEGGGSLHLL